MAAGEYAGDFTIKQYPDTSYLTNGKLAIPSEANNTFITFIGEDDTVFTGNVYVHGYGYSGGGYDAADGSTTFKNITFDASNSADEEAAEDKVVLYLSQAANDVTFVECTFQNATHITTGSSGSENGVGTITFDTCTFNDGGCLSGGCADLIIKKCVVNAAKAGKVTIENSTLKVGKYLLRTATGGSGTELIATNCEIEIYESEGAKDLVKFRGSNESATFTGCTIAAGYTTTGVDTDSTLTIN